MNYNPKGLPKSISLQHLGETKPKEKRVSLVVPRHSDQGEKRGSEPSKLNFKANARKSSNSSLVTSVLDSIGQTVTEGTPHAKKS